MTDPNYPTAHVGMLGKLPKHAELLPCELNLSNHLTATSNPLQFSRPGVDQIQYGMMLNDQLGDCTIAGLAHSVQVETFVSTGTAVTIPDDAVLAAYEALSHYNPATGENDTGCVESDVLDYWRTNGVVGHKIVTHGQIDARNIDHIKTAIRLFGFVYIGVQMPKGWCTGPDIWDIPVGADAAIEGGHCVILTGWDSTHFTLVSWGRPYKITYRALQRYCDEVHAVLSYDWLNQAGTDVDGLNLATLTQDLQAVEAKKHWYDHLSEPSGAEPSAEDGVSITSVESSLASRFKSLNWSRLEHSLLGGIGAAVLAFIGIWIKDSGASASDFIEAIVPAFVVGTGLSHWAPAGTIEAEALAKLEQDIIQILEAAVLAAENSVNPPAPDPTPVPAPDPTPVTPVPAPPASGV